MSGAIRSYIESEYDNLYQTHQCRPHAYGHTRSPGFEIEARSLHGHAVAIHMGFGAYLARENGWIDVASFDPMLGVMSAYGLSLWPTSSTTKPGGNLVAPLPRNTIGACGYLNDLSRSEYFAALAAYETMCAGYPRSGRGIDPLCSDVGFEDPSTISAPLVSENATAKASALCGVRLVLDKAQCARTGACVEGRRNRNA